MARQNPSKTESFIIKDLISKAIALRYLYIACILIFLLLALLINRYSSTVYEVNSIIGPVAEKQSSILSSKDLFGGIGGLGQDRNLENDMNSLNSFTLVATTLNKMNLEVGYFKEKKGLFRQEHQVYLQSPVKVNIDKSHIQPINCPFYIEIINGTSYRITSSQDKITMYNYIDNDITSRNNSIHIDTICRFNETITNKNFKFSVALNPDADTSKNKDQTIFYFELYNLDLLAKQYLKRLKIEPVNIKASLINVYFQGKNIELTIDFLNKYMQTYLDENLLKKNKISVNTIKFIDSQLSEISDSLVISESKLKDYRSSNQVMDLSYQGQRALEQMTKIETDRTNLQIQQRYYNYILDYFEKNKDMTGLAPPSAANVTDPVLNQLIMDLLSLNAQRSTILSNNNEKNLFLGQIENKIKLQKQAIIENVSNNLNTLNLSLNELNYRSEKLSNEISKLPRTELNMVSIQRKFNLSDAIYTFLLQKRSEAAITMASNYPDYEILEPARDVTKTVISPKKALNWILALLLGMLIPTLYIVFRDFFNENVTSVSDVEHVLNGHILNTIYSNQYKSEQVVTESPDSLISESFRNLRSSLFLKYKSEKLKVILVTSSQPQDGKSFISYNLAVSIASVGYKTIILDCDFRRPVLHSKFKEGNDIGLSNYMTNHTSKDEIIHPTYLTNLSYIPAGPLVPNPSELIESGSLDELINYLRTKYEYIIIDSTPAGIIADAVLMMKYSNINLVIVRNNYTRKDVFGNVLKLLKVNNVNNFDVVYNDLNLRKSRYGQYNNYYRKTKD